MDYEEHVELSIDDTDDTEQRVPIYSQLAVLGVVLALLLSASFTPKLLALVSPESTPSAVAETLATFAPTPPDESVFNKLTIGAEAAFVWDVETKRVLYQKNADKQLPLASITKLMTALIANELLTSTTTVTVSETAVAQDGTSDLRINEQFTLENLSDLILLSSSNDGAYAVAETLGAAFDREDPAAAFVALMNIRATELGLSQTYFRNPTGLDVTATEAGAYGSARDVAFLMEHILITQPRLIESTADPAHTIISRSGIAHTARNTNQEVSAVPGIIGSKTGYTELAGGNLVIAFNAGVNRPIIAVVLNSSWQGRFDDIETLTKATQQAL